MKANYELKKKVDEILSDEDTREWVKTIGSESAQINYPKHIAEYIVYRNLTIQQLVKNFKKDPNEEIKKLQQFVNHLLTRTEQKPLQPSSVGNYVSAIKSRMKYDSIQLVREVKIQDRHYHSTIAKETTPDVEKVDNLICSSKPSTQAITALIAYLGLRFKAIADLKVGDFPEMIVKGKEIVFEKCPTRVRIRPELNKGKKRGYETFLIENGCKILQNWLQIRMQEGERITAESLLIPTKCTSNSLRRRANTISRRFYTVFKKINFNSRPYSLKGFFSTQLMNSGIQQNQQTFLLGHSGPMQNEYIVQRQFSAEQIELMRKQFKEKIEPFLVPHANPSDVTIVKSLKKFATAFKVKTDDNASLDEITEKISAKIGEEEKKLEDVHKNLINSINRNITHKASEQKIITESELANYIGNGWRYQNTLPSGNLVIEQVKN